MTETSSWHVTLATLPSDLLLLVIDTDLVGPEIRYEHVPGQSQPYPHIYGPLNVSAVAETRPFAPGPDGEFSFRQP